MQRNTVYRVSDSLFVKDINPLVMSSQDQAKEFDNAQSIAESLEQSEGEAFRVGIPKKQPHA